MVRAPLALFLLVCAVAHAGAAGRREAVDAMVEWAVGQGAKLNGVEVRTDEAGDAGIFSTKPLRQATSAVSVPASLAMTPSATEGSVLSPLLAAVRESAELSSEQLEEASLSLLVVHERFVVANESRWAPYLSSLPLRVSTPAYWPQPALAALESLSDVWHAWRAHRASRLAVLRAIFTHAVSSPAGRRIFGSGVGQAGVDDTLSAGLSLHLFEEGEGSDGGSGDAFYRLWWPRLVWASHIISSRAFGARQRGDPLYTLVPLIDLANHEAGAMSAGDTDMLPSGQLVSYVLTAQSSLQSGQQLAVAYASPVCNYELLFSYGFVDDHRDSDCLYLAFGRSAFTDRPHGEQGLALALAAGLFPGDAPSALFHLRDGATLPRQLFYLLRLHLAEEEDGEALSRFRSVISLPNEQRVYKLLNGYIATLRAQFTTSVRDDVRALGSAAAGKWPRWRKRVLRLAIGRKRATRWLAKQLGAQWQELLDLADPTGSRQTYRRQPTCRLPLPW
eukprot:PLAT3886.2.p1 GENE.PLAT3886.2~~PLAT3886.2.p1  ORF type:complete len:504 (-),score=205.79 PLAT3886.2:147-1658(-)